MIYVSSVKFVANLYSLWLRLRCAVCLSLLLGFSAVKKEYQPQKSDSTELVEVAKKRLAQNCQSWDKKIDDRVAGLFGLRRTSHSNRSASSFPEQIFRKRIGATDGTDSTDQCLVLSVSFVESVANFYLLWLRLCIAVFVAFFAIFAIFAVRTN